VLSNHTCGIVVLITRSLAIPFPFIFPKFIKDGLYAVRFHRQGAYDGNIEAAAIARRSGRSHLADKGQGRLRG
jgi:hypothetical protein